MTTSLKMEDFHIPLLSIYYILFLSGHLFGLRSRHLCKRTSMSKLVCVNVWAAFFSQYIHNINFYVYIYIYLMGMKVGSSPDVVCPFCAQWLHLYSVTNRFWADYIKATILPNIMLCLSLCHPALHSGNTVPEHVNLVTVQREGKTPLLLKERGGGDEEREWEITPQPEGALSVVTCFLWVPWAGEAVMQARECWWQKHLRSPVSRRGVHPTSPVHHCYDCVFAASACQPLHNITIPTVGKHNMEHPHHLNSPLLPSPRARKWLYTVTVHQPMPPSICPSVGFPSPLRLHAS